jgi:hypothetical protein
MKGTNFSSGAGVNSFATSLSMVWLAVGSLFMIFIILETLY